MSYCSSFKVAHNWNELSQPATFDREALLAELFQILKMFNKIENVDLFWWCVLGAATTTGTGRQALL